MIRAIEYLAITAVALLLTLSMFILLLPQHPLAHAMMRPWF